MNTEEQIEQELTEHFGLNNRRGSYYYVLTRDKEAFEIGTMTINDFQEFTEEDIDAIMPIVSQALTQSRNQLIEELWNVVCSQNTPQEGAWELMLAVQAKYLQEKGNIK